MSWITSIFSFISASIGTAEANLKLAKVDVEAKRLANQEGNDADHDLQVLKYRRESIMDEIIITEFFGLFIQKALKMIIDKRFD